MPQTSPQKSHDFLRTLSLLLAICLIGSNVVAQAKFAGGGQINYKQVLKGSVLPSSGVNFGFHLGLSIGHEQRSYLGFIFLLGPSAFGTSHRAGLIPEDLSPYLVTNQTSPIDSERVEIIRDNFPASGVDHSEPAQELSYGILFSPFIHRFGGLQIQIRRGSYFYFPNLGLDRKFVENPEEYVPMYVPGHWTLQLSIKPLMPFRPKEPNNEVWWGDFLQLAIYGERISLHHATFDDQPFTRFFRPPFFNKYGVTYHFGFSIGLTIDSFGWD